MKTSAFETVLGLMIKGEEKYMMKDGAAVGLIYCGNNGWLFTHGIFTAVFDTVKSYTTDERLCDLYMRDSYVGQLDLKGVTFA